MLSNGVRQFRLAQVFFMQQSSQPDRATAKAWFIWSLSALAFGYAFFQRVAPSVMVPDLMAEFSIGAAVTGYLSALYFYPYVALQFPLGALLDRFGVRRLLTPVRLDEPSRPRRARLSRAYLDGFIVATGETTSASGASHNLSNCCCRHGRW